MTRSGWLDATSMSVGPIGCGSRRFWRPRVRSGRPPAASLAWGSSGRGGGSRRMGVSAFRGPADAHATPDALLKDAVQLGNRTIFDAAAEDIEKDGMGTTLVCALIDSEGRVVIANVGDSRAYAYLGGFVTLITVDHTWVNQQ